MVRRVDNASARVDQQSTPVPIDAGFYRLDYVPALRTHSGNQEWHSRVLSAQQSELHRERRAYNEPDVAADIPAFGSISHLLK